MCFYSEVSDPTHVSMEALELEDMRIWAATVITDRVGRNWKFGLEPYSRAERTPEVSSLRCSFCLRFFLADCDLIQVYFAAL